MVNGDKKMKIQVINHASFEKPGYFKTWAEKHGHQIISLHPHKGDVLHSPDDYDFLLIMGGPQSATELDKYPYLRDEIANIQEAMAKNKLVVGVCLGAQLIGEACGARTQRSPNPEIGVFPLELTEAAKAHPIFQHFPQEFSVAHWHNDMPGLTKEAKLLASSAGCPNQIIEFNSKTYGFQCHFEFTRNNVAQLIEHCHHELTPGQFIQTAEEMLDYDYSITHQYLDLFLNHFANVL